MTVSRAVLSLGAFAIASTTASLVLTLSFAVVLTRADLPIGILAIVASASCALAVISMFLLLYHRVLNGGLRLQTTTSRKRSKNFQKLAGLLWLLSDAVTLATLVWICVRKMDLPQTTLGAPTQSVLLAAFVLWGIICLAHGLLQLTLAIHDRTIVQWTRSLQTDEEPHNSSEMAETSRPQTAIPPTVPSESPSSTVSSRKRSGSATINSMRSSFSHVVRPTSSKSRLVPQKTPYRASSLDSGTGEREIVAEDGFDSWDTSAVDPQSWQTVMASSNSSPTQGRVLETIPASPTASRSPSPGYPLDIPLQPPQFKRRSRSHSPGDSFRTMSRRESAVSPTGSEAHIHPLFRSDSPTPPPSATPGTIVTAAPGAGLLIPDRRTVHRMRSGSLPTSPSPLVHSDSMDDIGRESLDEEEVDRSPPPEREMTPPIPDWILGAGPRSSLTGYTRRKAPVVLVPVGETREH